MWKYKKKRARKKYANCLQSVLIAYLLKTSGITLEQLKKELFSKDSKDSDFIEYWNAICELNKK